MKSLQGILILLGCVLWNLTVFAQGCNSAQLINDGIHNGYIFNDTPPTINCFSGASTATAASWYKYIPSASGPVSVSTDLGEFEINTRISIYSGDCSNLTCVANDDDSGTGTTSLITFDATAGTTYYIVFDNHWQISSFRFVLMEGPYHAPIFTPVNTTTGGMYHTNVVDMNSDYLDDLVTVNQSSVIIHYQSNDPTGFSMATLPAPQTLFMPSWSLAAGDFDKNGYNDLLYGSGTGAAIMLANNNGTAFTTKLESPQYVFSQRTNFTDINNDGHLDAFVCHDVGPNVYFLNNGTGGFNFHQGGLGDFPIGGNYGSIWVDYDNDGDSDLFLSKCRGGAGDPAAIDELHRNNGDGTFTNVAQAANMDEAGQAWSTAWGDFDNDGDMDALIGTSSNTSGCLLKQNNGDGTFTDITAGSGFDTFEGYSKEHVTYDFNNDGYLDIFSGNYRIMLNNGNMTFSPVLYMGYLCAVGDLNNDGFLDICDGGKIYYNVTNANNWTKICLQGIDSNYNGIGARIEIHGDWGIQIRDVRSGEGFALMSTLNTHFGLGSANAITQLIVRWPSGTVDIIDNPEINQALVIIEGLGLLNNTVYKNDIFTLSPNPVKDNLHIKGDNLNILKASIYDLSGKLIKAMEVTNATIPVQFLSHGTYIISLIDNNGKQHLSKFIKN